MRLVATEEHVATPEVVAAWQRLDPRWQDVRMSDSTDGRSGAALLELGDARIAAMDAAGIDVSVLSLTTPGVQSLEADEAVRLQTQVNDLLSETVRSRPDRFQAFATLATPDPGAAAKELGRAVTRLGLNGAMLFGRTRERNMDDPAFWPIYEAASALPETSTIAAKVGRFLILAGDAEHIERVRYVDAIFYVDDLDAFAAWLPDRGGEILHGVREITSGRNFTARHPDGLVAEYFEAAA